MLVVRNVESQRKMVEFRWFSFLRIATVYLAQDPDYLTEERKKQSKILLVKCKCFLCEELQQNV